jgi:hypothetical protein
MSGTPGRFLFLSEVLQHKLARRTVGTFVPPLLRQSLGHDHDGDQHCIRMLREPDQMLSARPAFAEMSCFSAP